MHRTSEEWIQVYKDCGGHWRHSGNPRQLHAELTSGMHTNEIFNTRLLISHDDLLREAASDLIEKFVEQGGQIEQSDWIIGPQTGGTKIAKYLAAAITIRRGRECKWTSTDKVGEGKNKTMAFPDDAHAPGSGDVCLLCDDVLATGGSIKLSAQAIGVRGAGILGFVLVLVNRYQYADLCHNSMWLRITSLTGYAIPAWTPEKCPLCKMGSKAIRPKGEAAWALLKAGG